MRRFPHPAGAHVLQRLGDGSTTQRAARVVTSVRAYEKERFGLDFARRSTRPTRFEFVCHLR
jgi:hypothetical protein